MNNLDRKELEILILLALQDRDARETVEIAAVTHRNVPETRQVLQELEAEGLLTFRIIAESGITKHQWQFMAQERDLPQHIQS